MSFVEVNEVKDAKKNRKLRQAFYTPKALVDLMIQHSTHWTGCKALEPSSGDGRIVNALVEIGCIVDACEIDNEMNERCGNLGANMIGTDFLKIASNPIYDLILMNPPFQKNQYLRHIEHAYSFLNPRGMLISITPPTVKREIENQSLKLPGCQKVYFEEMDKGLFKDHGTNTETTMVWIDGSFNYGECEGYSNHSTCNAALTISSTKELSEIDWAAGSDFLKGELLKELVKCGCSMYGVDWDELTKSLSIDEEEITFGNPQPLTRTP